MFFSCTAGTQSRPHRACAPIPAFAEALPTPGPWLLGPEMSLSAVENPGERVTEPLSADQCFSALAVV